MAKNESPDGLRFSEIEAGVLAQRVVVVPRGFGYSAAGTTGIMTAGLPAGGTIFGLRLDSGTQKRLFLRYCSIQYTTLTAYTVPITANRRLQLVRGTNTAGFTGGSIIQPTARHGIADTSEVSITNGGDCRIATTAGLGNSGVFNEAPFFEMALVHVGASGAFATFDFEAVSPNANPIQLEPGQVLALRAPAAFDAAGTWQATIQMDWDEAPILDYE